MSFFRILLLLAVGFSAQAEPNNPASPKKSATDEIQVHTKQSSNNVAALNHATEVLSNPAKALPFSEADNTVDKELDKVKDNKELPRDPTQMSGNFRQALKNIPAFGANNSNPNAPANSATPKIPAIELAAKIMGKNKSVMLKINTHVVQVAEGGQASLVDGQRVMTIRVDSIDKNQVKIVVLPFNEHLILQ